MENEDEANGNGYVNDANTLISAVNFLSRNLPLPLHLLISVSTIYHNPPLNDKVGDSKEDLMADLEDALAKQRPNCASGFKLAKARENRYQSQIQHRLKQLEELPSSRGEDLQTKYLLELYGLKLAELQSKVQSDVSSEYWLNVKCAYPDNQLFDWGMMRLQRPLYGIGIPFAMDADDQLRKKRDAERLSRLEEEEKNQIETRKRRFFAEILNTVREFQLQIQASLKRRKQRNDGVQDRREMLEEIMRKGTSSLGTDVPSEREINRLAARSDEEFWLFEKMDEERRQKENYRSRLMEEHELPDWVYSPLNKDDKAKAFNSTSVTGKRKRKDDVYADTLSDLQWAKAVESGVDISNLSVKGKRRDKFRSDSVVQASDNPGTEERFLELRTESVPMADERTSEDSFYPMPASKRLKPEGTSSHAYDDVRGSGLNQQLLSWNTHKKKRSSYLGQGSSSGSRGQNSNGRAKWN